MHTLSHQDGLCSQTSKGTQMPNDMKLATISAATTTCILAYLYDGAPPPLMNWIWIPFAAGLVPIVVHWILRVTRTR